jgi:predicted flap endonuclease-1-like 5' DNA nuclease
MPRSHSSSAAGINGGNPMRGGPVDEAPAYGEGPVPAESLTGYTLPISKLRGVPFQARVALKVRRITTCSQLLAAASAFPERTALAQAARLPVELLTEIVQRADMARVNGVGTVFGLMLEELGIHDVGALAAQEPDTLHERLRRYNREERLARRSPTPEEVSDWVAQARRLRPLVTYDGAKAAELTAAE